MHVEKKNYCNCDDIHLSILSLYIIKDVQALLSMKVGNGGGKARWEIVKKTARPLALDDTTHNNNIGCGRYRSYWPETEIAKFREHEEYRYNPYPRHYTKVQYIFFVHSDGGGGNVGFRDKILCGFMRYTASILYPFLELHICNIDQIIISCTHVSLTADEISHGVNVYICSENVPLGCYVILLPSYRRG